jgi:hypothetical protein
LETLWLWRYIVALYNYSLLEPLSQLRLLNSSSEFWVPNLGYGIESSLDTQNEGSPPMAFSRLSPHSMLQLFLFAISIFSSCRRLLSCHRPQSYRRLNSYREVLDSRSLAVHQATIQGIQLVDRPQPLIPLAAVPLTGIHQSNSGRS